MGGALAAVLLTAVLLVNLVSVLVITRSRSARLVAI
jgi:hypothetical protein